MSEWICRTCHTRGKGDAEALIKHRQTEECRAWHEAEQKSVEREKRAISLGRTMSFDRAIELYGSLRLALEDEWIVMQEHAGLMR